MLCGFYSRHCWRTTIAESVLKGEWEWFGKNQMDGHGRFSDHQEETSGEKSSSGEPLLKD